MSPPMEASNEAFFTRVFREWRAEFRSILEGHKRDIEARLEKIEQGMEKKSDKEHVELLVRGLQNDLRRHADEIDEIQKTLTNKLSTEAMWKIIGLVLTVGSAFGGIIGFVISFLMRS